MPSVALRCATDVLDNISVPEEPLSWGDQFQDKFPQRQVRKCSKVIHVEIREEPLSHVQQHGRISIAFEVNRVFDVASSQREPGKFGLVERPVFPTFVKDYDAEANGESRRSGGHA